MLISELIPTICLYPDVLTVQVARAPIRVTLQEAGLRAGARTVVSEG